LKEKKEKQQVAADGIVGHEVNFVNSTTKEMARFYLPLAATSVLMMSSHSIVSSGLARTAEASAALAAFALAQSLAVMFEGPCYTMQRMCVALFKDQISYSSVKKAVLGIWAGLTSVMLLIAFTPVGTFVFTRLLGVPAHLYPGTIGAFRIFLLLPAASALRSFFQGIIVVNRRTGSLTVNMIVRLGLMLLLSNLLPRLPWLPGATVGALVLSMGIFTEGLMAYLAGRSLFAKLPATPAQGKPASVRDTLAFFLPIALASVAWTFARPILNAALARTANPEWALASYQVAWSFSFIFAAVAFNIHQLTIIFGQEKSQRDMALKFSLAVGLIGSAFLAIVVTTPLGNYALTRIIGVSPSLAREALKVIAILSVMPIISTVTEFCNGLLISTGQTRYLTVGKILNITVITIVSSLGTNIFPQAGGQLAAVAMIGGALTEAAFLTALSRAPYASETLSSASSM
jgi:hypothetical protein